LNTPIKKDWPVEAKNLIRTLQTEVDEAHEELQRTNSDLLQLTLELEDRIEERTKALKESKLELRKHRDHLQELVHERTTDLNQLNRELRDKLDLLKASEERFRSLVLTIPDIVYRIDRDGNFTFINDAVSRLGYSPEELYGEHFSRIVAPADVELVSRYAVLPKYHGKATGEEGAPKLFDERRGGLRKTTGLEVRLIGKNQKVQAGLMQALADDLVLAEVNSSGMYVLSDEPSGNQVFIGTVGVIRDISSRREMERALRSNEIRLKAIFENAQAGIFLVDAETRKIEDINPAAARACGFPREKIVGSVCHQYLCPTEKGKCPVLDLGQKVDSAERVLLNAEGQQVDILKTSLPVALGNRLFLLESFVDITRLKSIENRLKRSQSELAEKVRDRTAELEKSNIALREEIGERRQVEAKLQQLLQQLKESQGQLVQTEKIAAIGTLTAGVAHELNNPMMGMLNFVQYCIKNTDPSGKIYGLLKDTERETRRCIQIVRNLLTFSRVKEEEIKETLKPDVLIDRVYRLLKYRIEKDNVFFEMKQDEDVPGIRVNESGMQQVFLNLISNALDAVHGCGEKRVEVRVKQRHNGIAVSVRDTGAGIDPKHRERIFDPFYTTKPVGKGTGLGLSVSRSIVEAHGGVIKCDANLETGTCFHVFLPRNGSPVSV
jgi:PAS domain S-box-containing protein